MWDKVKLFFATNWKTSVPALLAAVCASDEYFQLLPEAWGMKATATCTFLLAIGLIAAKDANVSNAPKPAEAQKVS